MSLLGSLLHLLPTGWLGTGVVPTWKVMSKRGSQAHWVRNQGLSLEVIVHKLTLDLSPMVFSFRKTNGRFWSDNSLTSLGVMGGLTQLGYPEWPLKWLICCTVLSRSHRLSFCLSGTSSSWLEEASWPGLLWVPSLCLSSSLLCALWFWSTHWAHRKCTGGLSSFRWAGRHCVTWVCTTRSIICKNLLPWGKAVCLFGCTEPTEGLLVLWW